MKKHLQLSAILLGLGALLFAQEKTEVTVTVVKDGKVLRDTTYAFDDAKKAKHAIHMMDMMASGDEEILFHDNNHKMVVKSDGDMKKHQEHMMFISEDGEKISVMGDHGDHDMVWVEEGEEGHTKVIVKKMGDGDWEHGDKKVMKKEVIIISDEDGEKGTWTTKEIKGEDGEVIVIKKKQGKDGDQEVEVEVIMKEEKEMKEKQSQEKMVKKEEIEKTEKQKKKK